MKTLISALALTAAITPAALAGEPATPTDTGPLALTEAQMEQVTAGGGAAGGVVNDALRAGAGNNNGDRHFRHPTVSGGGTFSEGNEHVINAGGRFSSLPPEEACVTQPGSRSSVVLRTL
jgi:hypothetical protein